MSKLLPAEAVDRLSALARAGVRARAETRTAVIEAAELIGVDAVAPPLPDFDAGESMIGAAVRVLSLGELRDVSKAIDGYRARRNAAEANELHYDRLHERRRELTRIELGRRDDHVQAGKVPPRTPPEAIAEMGALLAELELLGSRPAGGTRSPGYPSEHAALLDALPAAAWPTMSLYGGLVGARLDRLSVGHASNSPIATAQRTAAQQLNVLQQDARHRGHEQAVRSVWAAVSLAAPLLDSSRIEVMSVAELDAAALARAGR